MSKEEEGSRKLLEVWAEDDENVDGGQDENIWKGDKYEVNYLF